MVRCTYSKATDGTFRFRKWRNIRRKLIVNKYKVQMAHSDLTEAP